MSNSMATGPRDSRGGADAGPQRGGAWDRLYAILLYAYPRSFRSKFGADMCQLMRDRRRALRNASPGHVFGFCLDAVRDVAVSVPREHADELRRRCMAAVLDRSPGRRSRLIGCVLIALSVLHVLFDLATPKLRMGVLAWLLTALTAVTGAVLVLRRPSGGAAA